jgi:non-ribosomal peptide synthetase component E (peptide arylation enzyme)
MSNVFDKSGFYKPGDLGSISAKGEISIHGRANQDGTRHSRHLRLVIAHLLWSVRH